MGLIHSQCICILNHRVVLFKYNFISQPYLNRSGKRKRGKEGRSLNLNTRNFSPAPLFVLSPRQFILEYHLHILLLLSFLTMFGSMFPLYFFHYILIQTLLIWPFNSLVSSLCFCTSGKSSIHACLRELRRRPKTEKETSLHIYIILD